MTVLQYISIDNLTLLWTGKTYNAIRMMIQRKKIKDVVWFTKKEASDQGLQWKEGGGGGKNGKRPFISIDDPAIPQEVRELFKNNGNIPVSMSGNEAPSFPEPEHSCPSSTQGQGVENISLAPPFFPGVSEKYKQIACARYDLLKLWDDYREDKNRPHATKGEADEEFLLMYHSGACPRLFELLGEVSIKTLYNWSAKIRETKDWKDLIPQSNYSDRGGVPQLMPEEIQLFLNFLLHPNKVQIDTAYRFTKYALEKRGIQVSASSRTFRRYAERYKEKHYDTWVFMREGQKALRDKVVPFIKRDPSLLNVGDVVVADGHVLNFTVINPFTGRPCRATLIGYFDWKSSNLCGYEIAISENIQVIASALRNAILRLGKYPTVSYQDNGKAFKARFFRGGSPGFNECGFNGLFGRLGITPLYANCFNARAKVIERFFREFSNTFERLMPSFTGSSIADKPARLLRNEKFHKAMHNEYVPTIEETVERIESWLEFHRSQPCPHVKGKTIGEVFNEGKGPGVDMSELDDLMLDEKIMKIGRNGIRFLKAEYNHDFLYGMREEVIIKYSLFDLSYIRVYSQKGEFYCTAERVTSAHPMARVLGDAKDMEDLKRRIADQKSLSRSTIRVSREHIRKNGKLPELDWQKVAENTPGAIEKIKDMGADFPSEERHIPEWMLQNSDTASPMEEEIESEEKQPFHYEYQRYEYLLNQLKLSDDERRWMKEFENTSLYKAIYKRNEHFVYDDFCTNSWEKYEYLVSKPYYSEKDWKWMQDYEDGKIFPGEYKAYQRNKQKMAVGDNQ